jgi:hypothetical protein
VSLAQGQVLSGLGGPDIGGLGWRGGQQRWPALWGGRGRQAGMR